MVLKDFNANLALLSIAVFIIAVLLIYFQWKKDISISGLFNSDRLRIKFLKNFYKSYRLAAAIIIALVFLLSSLVLFNPSWGKRERSIFIENLDILFIVDISNSMNVNDVSPTRLGRAKEAVKIIVSQLSGQRLGILAFARSAFYYCPFTADYDSFLEFLQALNSDNIPDQGTEMEDVFTRAREIFQNNQASAKTAIILSDGEIHQDLPSGDFNDDLDNHVQSFVLGVGTEEGRKLSFTYQKFFFH